MPVCCFGNQQEQNVQQVQPAQTMQSPVVQPIVMPVMNLCAPTNPYQTGYMAQNSAQSPYGYGVPQGSQPPIASGIIGNGYNGIPQNNVAPIQVPNNGYGVPQGTQPIGSSIYGNGYNGVPQNASGYEQTQGQIPQGGITINISNSQDKNSKNTANKSETQSQQPFAAMQQQPPQKERVVRQHVIERKPVFITKNQVRTQIKTRTYYKVVRVPVEIEKNKFVYVNRFVPYNACEGATPNNVNNGFV